MDSPWDGMSVRRESIRLLALHRPAARTAAHPSDVSPTEGWMGGPHIAVGEDTSDLTFFPHAATFNKRKDKR